MKVVFYASEGRRFDDAIAAAFSAGCQAVKLKCTVQRSDIWAEQTSLPGDLAIVVGVKSHSKPIFDAYRAAGKHAAVIDKGYIRARDEGPLRNLYWRMSVDAFQPHAYLFDVPRTAERWEACRTRVSHRARQGETILFAGSSQKYCDWHKLGDCTEFAKATLAEVQKYSSREIVYRPKPSWKDKCEIPPYRYSTYPSKFAAVLAEANCVITYGSNACLEAAINGVPAVVLGDGIAQFKGLTRVRDVANPVWPGQDAVLRLAYHVAHCQWTLAEMAAGLPARELTRILEV